LRLGQVGIAQLVEAPLLRCPGEDLLGRAHVVAVDLCVVGPKRLVHVERGRIGGSAASVVGDKILRTDFEKSRDVAGIRCRQPSKPYFIN
jgi:hypothetical protein